MSINWNNVRPGDTLLLKGKQSGPFLVGASGTKQKPIILKSDPSDPCVWEGGYLSADKMNWYTIKDITFLNSGQFRSDGGDGVKFKGCLFDGLHEDNIRLIQPMLGNDDWTFKGCDFRNVPNAIYSTCTGDLGAERSTVDTCSFRHIGSGSPRAKDGHAIGIQCGSGHTIIGNYTEDTGTAICLWAPPTAIMRDCRITYNFITGAHKASISEGHGIALEGKLPLKGLRTGNKIMHNNIEYCDGNGIRATLRDPITLHNNGITHTIKEPIKVVNK